MRVIVCHVIVNAAMTGTGTARYPAVALLAAFTPGSYVDRGPSTGPAKIRFVPALRDVGGFSQRD